MHSSFVLAIIPSFLLVTVNWRLDMIVSIPICFVANIFTI